MNGGAWRAKVPGAAKESDTTYQLNNNNINNNKNQFLFKAYRILGDNLYQPLKVLYEKKSLYVHFRLVQFSRSVMSDSLRPHESQHARPPCPSPTPGVYSNSCPSSQ